MFPMMPMKAESAAIRTKPPINLILRGVLLNDTVSDLDGGDTEGHTNRARVVNGFANFPLIDNLRGLSGRPVLSLFNDEALIGEQHLPVQNDERVGSHAPHSFLLD